MSELTIIYSRGSYFIEQGENLLQLEFSFQRIFDFRDRNVLYFEVLTQMLFQTGEYYENEDFFDGLTCEFGKILAILQLKFIQRKRLLIQPVINVTLSSLEDEVFIKKLLTFSMLQFVLEVTVEEQSIDISKVTQHINLLHHSGIKIWLDDYHPNDMFASATLGEIKWDRIKVNSSAVKNLMLTKNIISSLIFVLEPFTRQGIVLDGIENRLMAESILSLDVLAQGSFYSDLQSWNRV